MPAPLCRRTILTLCLTLLTIAPFSLASAEEPELWKKHEQRLKAEATALFKVILAELETAPERCLFGNQWSSYPVPYELANKYLGHAIHTDIRGLKIGAKKAEILDPSGTHPESFCSPEEFYREGQQRIEKVLAAERTGEKRDPNVSSKSDWHFTFPVFDKKFRTAVVVRHSSNSRWFVSDGRLLRPFSMSGGARLYRKVNGRWQLITHKPLYWGSG